MPIANDHVLTRMLAQLRKIKQVKIDATKGIYGIGNGLGMMINGYTPLGRDMGGRYSLLFDEYY